MNQTGIIFDVKRFAVHDGPGIRTTVFFKGCPLNCQWCHNPESRHPRPERLQMNGYHRCARWLRTPDPGVVGKEVSADECLREVEKDVVFYDQSGGGVTFSGGEPLMQPRFLETLLRGCRERSIHTAVDTSGHAEWTVFESIMDSTDLFLFDVKLADETEHRSRTGVGSERIRENLKKLHDAGANVIIRIPLIPSVTDTESNLMGIRALLDPLTNIKDVHLLPYNTISTDKYRRLGKPHPIGQLQKQSPEQLTAMEAFFAGSGLAVKIGG